MKLKYSTKLAQKICEAVSTGNQSIGDICNHFGIGRNTFYCWKNTIPEFSEMVEAAENERLDNLGEMAESGLKLLITKHEYDEVTTEIEDNGNGEIKKSKKIVKKVVMPCPAAVIFTLTNRNSKKWKQKQSIEHLDKDGMPTNPVLTVMASSIPLAGSEKDVSLE